ncbi:MAG TPA: MFS transporter [Chloroflexota bacterium]|nr:MFS transporter [Chloroflexota bacterium]
MTSQTERGEVDPQTAPRERLWTRTFALVWLNQFLSYASNWITLPVLPLFLARQGQSESYIGLVLAAFSITSFTARPFFGQQIDRGRGRGALAGSSACLSLAALGYLVPNAPVLFLSRAVHGLGWAGINAVGSGWVAVLAPARRRAEAIAYYTTAQAGTVVFGPVLGLAIARQFGDESAFAVAGAVAILAVLAILGARQAAEAHHAEQYGQKHLTGGWWSTLIERSAVPATILLGVLNVVGPASVAYMPLYFLKQGLEHPDFYFLAQGLTGVLGRAGVGRLGDRLGRKRMIGVGILVQFGGFVLLAAANSLETIILAGSIVTLGNAVREPSFYALVIDRAEPARRGAALATYTMGFQIGSGIGSALWGNVIQYFGYTTMYVSCLVPLAASLVMLAVMFRERPQPRPIEDPIR